VLDAGLLPLSRGRADDSGCPKAAEEGNDVGRRHKAQATIFDGTTIIAW
jgi:hypothetical protein